MLEIRDANGKVIQRSRNLRGIREYVGKTSSPISCIEINRIGEHEGKLSILFCDGVSFETNFASFNILKDFVRRWRNTYGAPLRVNGYASASVNFNNPRLQ